MSAGTEPEAGHPVVGGWRDLIATPERAELAVSVRRHFAARFPREVARQAFGTGQPPAGAWQEIAASGYPLAGLPGEYGGDGSMADLAALLEVAGQELLPAPLLATVAAWQTLVSAGLPVRDPLRPAALALGPAAPAPGTGALAPATGGQPGTRVRLRRLPVLDGALAQRLIVVLPTASGSSASGSSASGGTAPGTMVAEVDAEVLRPAEVHVHVDPSRPVAVFDLDLGQAATQPAILAIAETSLDPDTVLARARVALAADLTGTATGALDRAVQHALDREQFGKKIGAFQGIKHRLADVYVAVERARSLTRAAAVAVAGPPGNGADDARMAGGHLDARELSLLAKAAATEAAVDATRACVQVLGAMGMTFEADAHLYFRRAQQTAPVLGSSSECYRRAARRRQERGRPEAWTEAGR